VTLKLLYALSADPYRRKTSSSAALKCEHLFRYAKHAQRVKQCGTRHLKQEEYNAWTTDDVKEKNSSFGVRTLLIAEVDGRRTTKLCIAMSATEHYNFFSPNRSRHAEALPSL
jgi:hypothetical protein